MFRCISFPSQAHNPIQGKASQKGREHMKGRRLLLSVVLASVVALALAGAASAARLDVAEQGGRALSTELTGAAEVPTGDLDGSGTATITVNPGKEEVCWEIVAMG